MFLSRRGESNELNGRRGVGLGFFLVRVGLELRMDDGYCFGETACPWAVSGPHFLSLSHYFSTCLILF